MGSIISSSCNSGILSDATQASCEFVLNGISGKTFDEIYWRLKVNAQGHKDTTYNIKFENLTKTITIFQVLNTKLCGWEEGDPDLLKLTYNSSDIISQNWVGDTLKASIIKQSGDTPKLLQIYTIAQTHYSD